MSDENPDVAPQASVVDFPSDHEEAKAAAETGAEAESAADALVDADGEGPVSLDTPKEEAEPEAEAEQVAADADGDADSDAESDTENEGEATDEEAEPEVYEFDFGGNKLEVPKGDMPESLAEEVGKYTKAVWADYTKKSQANAEEARALAARSEHVEKLGEMRGEILDLFGQGKSIKAEIEQLSAIDLNNLSEFDYRRVSDSLAAKRAELTSVIGAIDERERSFAAERQAELERQTEEGRTVLDRKYKDFSTKIAPQLVEYAQKQGMTAEQASEWPLNPVLTEMAYKAMRFDQMQAATKPKATPKPAQTVKAIPNKGGSRGPANPNDMGFAELGKELGIPT